MKQKFILLIAAVSLLALHALAQQKIVKKIAASFETLTDASIIELSKAGLGDDVILSKIATSQSNFDLSTAKLIELKKAGVNSAVINAMMAKASGATVAAVQPSKAPPVVKIAGGSIPDVKVINEVFGFNKSGSRVVPLEKVSAALKFKKKLLGYGGMDVMYIVPGTASPVRLSVDEAKDFLMNTGGPAPDMILYQLSITKDSRQAITQKVKAMASNATPDDNMIPFAMEAAKPNVYQFTPKTKLQKGEYFFIVKPITSATVVDAYAFGID